MWIPRDSCEDNKRFKCKRGYVSQVQTTCKNGVWILEPACQVLAVECPQGVKITNSGDVTESRIFGEDFSYDCKTGYTKNGGVGTLRCGVNGTWTEQQACQECPQGVNITNSDDVTESRIFSEDFSFNCSVGYTKNGKTGILRCGENDMWTEQQDCQAVECPQGVNITNSDDVTESRIFGEDFSYNCKAGYTRNGGTGTLKCGENGTWTEQIACQSEITNETYVEFFTYGGFPANCHELCTDDTKCGFTLQIVGNCVFYPKPILYTNPNLVTTLSECIKKCKDNTECLTISHHFTCTLFSANYTTVASKFRIVSRDDATIVTGLH
ncbi:hypothetical protein LOTGIDRAFT_172352 [Lottia gigantea]|uniref:Sushi domain-containing protein n=1 Tax=Lottia gigantea TaxID=225164 RepID=V4AWC2_LOTGI|nr:hypothetical protein LOTGIDRAFT_172352 [Lottia gigantea]ESP01798.1 hypothetical protein LOTGIDRAFT_172352 [Lottia gigantea]